MTRLKILAAEDEEVIRQLIRIGLKDEEQFELRLVADGEEVLVAYKKFKPDIILLDIMMPNMNGFEVLSTIRTTLNDKKTVILVISSVSAKGEIMALLKLGIQGYILKPFQTKTLAETVLRHYRKAKAAAKPQSAKPAASKT